MNHLNQTYNSIKYRYNGLPNKIQIIIIALSVSLIYILPCWAGSELFLSFLQI